MNVFNRLLPLFWGLFLLSSVAFAQTNQPSPIRQVFIAPPQDIVKKAAGTRYNFTDAITEIRNGELELASTVEEVYGYILILDDLKKIETELEFPVWGVSPVKELGFYLTKIISRKINIATISDDALDAVLRWSEDENTFSILENLTDQFSQNEFPQEACLIAFKHATLMLDLELKLKAPLMLIGAVETFQRTVFLRLLKTYKLNISVEELTSLLKDLRSVDALMDTLKYFHYETYDLKNPQDYLNVFHFVVAIAKVDAENFPHPLYDFDNSYGEIISTMIVKMLESGLWLERELLKDYKNLLKTKDIETIATQLLNFPVNQYKLEQLIFVADLTQLAIDYNLSANRLVEARDLKLVYQEIMLGLEIQRKNLEGYFEVSMNGMKAYITIIQSNSTNLAANISLSNGYTVDNFPFARFNLETNEIEFSKLERDLTGQTANDDLLNKLSVKIEGNTFVGIYANTENIYKMTGTRFDALDKPETLPFNPSLLPGRYKSQIGDYKVQLNIKEVKSNVYSASLNFTLEGVYTPILAATFEEYTFIKSKNMAYFSDLRVSDDEKIKQLRIYLNADKKLCAQYILSGSKEVKTLVLQK